MGCNTATEDGIVEEFTRRENARVCGGGGVAVVGSRFQMEGRACCEDLLPRGLACSEQRLQCGWGLSPGGGSRGHFRFLLWASSFSP